MRREDPARVLPIALAQLCAILSGRDPDAYLEEWGVLDPDDAAERAAEKSVQNFRAIAARLNQQKKPCQAAPTSASQ